MDIQAKKHFNFGLDLPRQQEVYLHLRRTYTNIFVTLTDMDKKVIICKTSGSAGIKRSKRRKRAPQALEHIVKSLLPYFKLYEISRVKLILGMRRNALYYYLSKELSFNNISISNVIVRRSVAFNGVKRKKIRRV